MKGDVSRWNEFYASPFFKYRIKRLCSHESKAQCTLILGDSESGKTHLAYAMGELLDESNKDSTILNAEYFIDAVLASLGTRNGPDRFIQSYSEYEFVLVDDCNEFLKSSGLQSVIASLVHQLLGKGVNVILFGSGCPAEYEKILSELRGMEVSVKKIRLPKPRRFKKIRIILRKCKKLSMKLPWPMIWQISSMDGVRAMEGYVNALGAYRHYFELDDEAMKE